MRSIRQREAAEAAREAVAVAEVGVIGKWNVECPRSEAESARHVHPGAPPPTHADEGVRRHSSPLSEEEHHGNLVRGQLPSTDDRDFLERDLEVLADGTEVGLPCPRVDALGTELLTAALVCRYYPRLARRVLRPKRISGSSILFFNKRSRLIRVARVTRMRGSSTPFS